jgi:hypothetical protein
MIHNLISFLSLTLLLHSIEAWGYDGHAAIGYIANSFLAEKVRIKVNAALMELDDGRPGPGLSMANPFVANYADRILYDKRYHGAFAWSKRLHYVDAKVKDGGGNCSFDPTRDSGDGINIVSAIANYTTRVSLCFNNEDGCGQDIAFLTHFIGDVVQPLHVCGKSII